MLNPQVEWMESFHLCVNMCELGGEINTHVNINKIRGNFKMKYQIIIKYGTIRFTMKTLQ